MIKTYKWGNNMIFDDYFAFEITEVIKIIRGRSNHKTKKREISTLSCRIKGESTFFENDNETKAEKGDIFFIPEGTEYSQQTDGEEVIVIHLKVLNTSGFGMECFSATGSSHIISEFERMFSEWTEKKPGYRQRCAAQLYSLLADINVKRICGNKGDMAKIARSLTYMQANFKNTDISVEMLAGISGISEIYFRKIWSRIFKEPPAKYLQNLRIEYAKTLLSQTEYNITQIAEKCGFCDSKYFSTRFKKITGKTPVEYRKDFFE